MRYLKICFKASVFLAVCLILSPHLSPRVYAQDLYGNIADYLNNIYGTDENAGLTAFPVLNIPMGGRAEGLAGAFSAISDDISFLEFNPAGSSMLERTELGFFHNNWIGDTNIEAAAFTTRFGNWGFAGGLKWLYMPFTEYNLYGERASSGYYSEGVFTLNSSYTFFSSYSFSGVSLGVNLKTAFRMMPDFSDNYDNIIAGSGSDQSTFAIMMDIGLLTRFNWFKFYTSLEKNMSAAFVIRNFGAAAKDEALPTALSFAVSYKPIRPLQFSLDFVMPVNLLDPSLSEKPYLSFGFSANITNFLSMRTGIMFKAGSSRFTIGSELNLNKMTLDINYTLDLLTQFQPLNRISLAVRFDLGDNGRQLRKDRVEDLYLIGLEAYSREEFSDARFCWEEALRLDPQFEPAREGLIVLEKRQDLLQRIEEMYIFNF